MGIIKCSEFYNHETGTYRSLYDIAHVVLCGEFKTLDSYFEKQGILKRISEAVTIKKRKEKQQNTPQRQETHALPIPLASGPFPLLQDWLSCSFSELSE